MTVNGISGSSYQYQNMLNLIRLSGTGRSSGHQAVSPVKRVTSATSSSKAAYEDIQNFLKDYQSKLTGLETAALKLTESSSKNVWNDYQVTTTDSSVAVASASYRLKGDTDITLNVQSLAQTQQNKPARHTMPRNRWTRGRIWNLRLPALRAVPYLWPWAVSMKTGQPRPITRCTRKRQEPSTPSPAQASGHPCPMWTEGCPWCLHQPGRGSRRFYGQRSHRGCIRY